MRCTKARELMSAASDGELGAAGLEALAAHLECCPGCRTERERLGRVRALLAQAPRHEPRPGLSLRVLAAARQDLRPRAPWLPGSLRTLARAAAFPAVVAVGVVAGTLLAGAPDLPGGPASALPSLETFAAAPPDSPGGAYLAMLGAGE